MYPELSIVEELTKLAELLYQAQISGIGMNLEAVYPYVISESVTRRK